MVVNRFDCTNKRIFFLVICEWEAFICDRLIMELKNTTNESDIAISALLMLPLRDLVEQICCAF